MIFFCWNLKCVAPRTQKKLFNIFSHEVLYRGECQNRVEVLLCIHTAAHCVPEGGIDRSFVGLIANFQLILIQINKRKIKCLCTKFMNHLGINKEGLDRLGR